MTIWEILYIFFFCDPSVFDGDRDGGVGGGGGEGIEPWSLGRYSSLLAS